MPDITDILRRLDPEIWLVTAEHAGRRGGLIATFVNSASIVPDAPRMLVGIAKQHHTHGLIEASRAFTLHLLDESHLDWVWRFGLQSGHASDKFAAMPVLAPVAWMKCRVESSLDTGDRTIFLAEVLDSKLEKQTPPLTIQRLLQLTPPERFQELRDGMTRDAAVDAAAIEAWARKSYNVTNDTSLFATVIIMNIYKALLFACVLIFPWTMVAEAQMDDAVKDEMKKLQGVWQVTKWFDADGTPAPADEVKRISFEFKEDRIIKRMDGKGREPLKVLLDPTKKPKWIEFDRGAKTEVKLQGIYKLEGDELTICIIGGSSSDQPPERPTEFKANEKKHHRLIVMKKVKK